MPIFGTVAARNKKCVLGWESDGKDKYKDPEDLAFLQQKEIECREELIALCSDKDQFGVLIACEHRYIGEAHDVLGNSNKVRDSKTGPTNIIPVLSSLH